LELSALIFVLCALYFANSTYKSTVESIFAPEERDVYSYEPTPTDLAPLGAKPGNETFAEAGKSDCAPTELRSKERTSKL
jgi:hypothetical protein